ncbi:putative molybdenum cofactor sulfurase protein [Talaromyces proteolyticus]|uniref:Molybdenum cofactor sulfurase n=1 Tax=Talaromyces proteolyticus TaxID=1131652 RepID=A0AAD4KSS8_9EURO|nr:putative molybdenum cofactor sulfurase protein [Talaromyces proteolyticus]KAH8700258.1 putative molybdenum cofactor sulfurase protein [Talaromyces proteolyticus]
MADPPACPINTFYPEPLDEIRHREYPLMKGVTYMDHAGCTLYAKSLIELYTHDLTSNLFGNPHSASASSQLTTSRVDDIRLRALRFFNADPDIYDLVFVANATAGIKLVADTLRDHQSDSNKQKGFWYGYHIDSHTSLVGVREVADQGYRCFDSNEEVQQWINNNLPTEEATTTNLFAYPAQSNMNGRRLPLKWCSQIRDFKGRNTFTLLDAASFVTSTPLDLSHPLVCPDFVVLSFYKIFGFPDLGALIVRKDSTHIFQHRRGAQWHAKKDNHIHEQVEDGTLPFHSIIALDSALKIQERLYGSMRNVSAHTSYLAQQLYQRLSSLKHANGLPVCHIYISPGSSYGDTNTQGPIIALNLMDINGKWVGKSEVEKLAAVKGIHIRSGTLCNPGGAASLLNLTGDEMKANFEAGQRCGDENDLMQGKPTGTLRVSLGAMSNWEDINSFVAFIEEYYVESVSNVPSPTLSAADPVDNRFYVETLCVYPIKSCAGFNVPSGAAWKVHAGGLAWDREWCIVHQGTGTALSQKRYPRMALIKPYIDLENNILHVTCGSSSTEERSLDISLSSDDSQLLVTEVCQNSKRRLFRVCGDKIVMEIYSSPRISAFFSGFLGVPCTLARASHSLTPRRAKMASINHVLRNTMPGSYPPEAGHFSEDSIRNANPILLSNESPILLISRSSVNRLNEHIKVNTKSGFINANKAVAADVFRANIIVAENLYTSHCHLSIDRSSASLQHQQLQRPSILTSEQPYIEDTWSSFTIGPRELSFDVLGSCERCQMVCVNQATAERHEEPFSTLAKTRRIGGKVLFGRHVGLSHLDNETSSQSITVGDIVMPSYS